MIGIDKAIFYALYSIGGAIHADWLFVIFSSYLVYVAVAVFLLLLFFRVESRRQRWYVLLSFFCVEIIARGILTETIRMVWSRARPFVALPIEPLFSHAASASFPSGHAVFMVVLALVTFLIHKKWGWAMLITSLVVGFSRVIAGVHWPSDVVGALLVALVSFWVVFWVLLPYKTYMKLPYQREETIAGEDF